MGLDAQPVVEHIEYRAGASQHDAFVAAFAEGRRLRLAARGCRSVELTRSSSGVNEYRARIEWRSSAEHAAFAASEAAGVLERTMAPFERHAHHVDTPIFVGHEEVELDSPALRRAFGQYPTGVAVITALSPEGPVGMVVSSFTTVSLRPALVAFCAARTSTTWPVIADARSCCINVLAASQRELCQQLATRRDQRFEAVAWSGAASGAPILAGVVGWLDCRIVEVRVAGDHDFVLLEVRAHDARPELEPLLFHRSGYRAVASSTDVKDGK
jgi:3-hydroxy-9,10-secoandrosta-1,3,5(10)-triene-9,17-dione monooxygenase reductase component